MFMKPGAKLAMLVLVAGCQSLTAGPGTPALIVEPDDDSRAALQATLSDIFGGSEIRLASDALTRSSLLTLDTGFRKVPGEQPASGRVLSAPFKFRLIKVEDDCILVDLRDGKRHLLANTDCVPE